MNQKDLDKLTGRKMPKLILDKLKSFLLIAVDILHNIMKTIFLNKFKIRKVCEGVLWIKLT